MRKRRRGIAPLTAACTVIALGSWQSRADQKDPRLDPLFERLQVTEDAAQSALLQQAIWGIWFEIDDAQSASLLESGSIALANRDWEGATQAFDALIARSPGFAEGWNRRATLRWLEGDLDGSIADIQQTLALEPRHFGALSGLGLVLTAEGQDEAAMKAFASALQLVPGMTSARLNLQQLRERLGGEPL